MHRLNHWRAILAEKSFSWKLRSELSEIVEKGMIILWDTMGELIHAYSLARGAFVGGSLAPVGGQNFLEPLSCGLKPVIGPSWFNFYWIGKEIFEQNLVSQVNTWQEVSKHLQKDCEKIPDQQKNINALNSYIRNRKGGTKQACETINKFLSN